MCQLLGLNSSKPVGVGFSFAGFAERGGRTDEHSDGWGIAFHDAEGCHLITDQQPAASSPRAISISQKPKRARHVVAHIRKATQGAVSAANSHPFTRALWGRTWSFAHNGDLKDFQLAPDAAYQPVGESDSEQAFCHLLSELFTRFPHARPPRQVLFDALAELAAQVAAHGTFNFLLSDGDVYFAHCSTRLHYVVREYPFRSARLIDCDMTIDFGRQNHLDDRIAVIATTPLTVDETWHAFAPGELKMFEHGAPCPSAAPAFIGLPISY